MDRILQSFRRSKRAKGQGSEPTSTHTSGRSTPDPRSSSQATVNPHFGDQPTPDLRSSDESTPKSRHITDQYSGSQRTLLELTSNGQLAPEGAIFGLTSIITESNELLRPLRAACAALRVLLQTTKSIGKGNEDGKALIKRLNFHLATLENDIAKLEEDQGIDETIPVLNPDVRETLETYAREIEETYQLLLDKQPKSSLLVRKITDMDHNQGIIAEKTREIDEAFQRYTNVLQLFAASTAYQMRQRLALFRQEFPQESENAHTKEGKVPLNRPNAYGVQHRECLQGTREKTLPAISQWVDDENTEKWIFFFLDVAGSGKSTIAKHVAVKWKREKRLLARFFFSRESRATMSTDLFCSTVAGAFAALDPIYQKHMDQFMKVPNMELLPFEERFEGLVASPLRAIGGRAILIIDALDECHPEQLDQLLQILHDQHSSIPLLRILATGRPERDIKRWANEVFGCGYTNFIRLEESDKDVELYIKHTLRDLPSGHSRLYPVIRHAEGLFIWARIACDLLLNSDDSEGLLVELGKEVSLDYLYKVALEQSMPKEGASQRAMILVLQMILAASEPLSIAELEVLSLKHGVVEKVVTRLGSVLLYQGRDDPIRLLHYTFREFLTTRSKGDIFFVQPELGHHILASGCLNTISYILQLEHSTLRELGGVSNRKAISFSARYLLTAYRKLALNKQILEFVNGGLKTWINLADKWRGLDAQACINSVSFLSHQNMSPKITEVVAASSYMSFPTLGGRATSGNAALTQIPAIHSGMDLDVLESEPFLARRFGVHVPNLSGQVRRLSEGTMFPGTYSTVYPGMCGDKKVAIKVLRAVRKSDNIQRKFRRELFIWWSLRHDNVLPLYGYFEDKDGGHSFPSLISKWAENESAAQYITRDLRWDQRTALFYDVAKGLNYLHGFKPVMVHADLKPQNVVVDKDGVGQLCDFGLTCFMQDGMGTDLTTTSTHTGTVRYLAYELVDYEDKPVPTAATDMYALGCLGLEFIYRAPPHASSRTNHGKITRAIFDGIPPAKRPVNPQEVVPMLWDLVEACWINTPSGRPTAAQVSDYLEKNLEALSESLEQCSWAPEYLTR